MSEQLQQVNFSAQELYKFLRARTIESKTTSKKQLTMAPPESISREEMSALLAMLGTEQSPAELADIAWINGRKDIFYYEKTLMTVQYAELDAMIQEKDLLHTIATVTRSDCKLYPMPTQFSKLKDVPFRMSEDELLGAAARMMFEPEYEDIKVCTASNGGKAFYSTKYLTPGYAQSLIEWEEVERRSNP